MHIVITGGSGYIGHNLIKLLTKTDHKLTVVSRSFNNSAKILSKNIKYLQLDLLSKDDENIYKTLGKPDVLVHLAWESGFIHNESSHYNNILKHINFIENMLKGGLSHLSIAGTVHEVGYFVGEVDENTPTNPQNLYGIAKNFLRQLTEILCENYSATYQWLRFFYIYGDDINNNSVFTKILKACRENKKNFYLNSGELLCDFIHIDTLTSQINSVISQNEVNGIINCCTGNPISLKTMVDNFVKNNDLPITINYDKFPIRDYDSRAIWGSNKKISLICK
jgi:nucleoside-diphosphate-sugar epimerase